MLLAWVRITVYSVRKEKKNAASNRRSQKSLIFLPFRQVAHAFFDSFKDNGDKAPWAKDGTTGQEAIDYFFAEIVGQTNSVADGGKPTEVVRDNVGYSFLSWTVIWLCIAFGVKWTGRYVLVPEIRVLLVSLLVSNSPSKSVLQHCLLHQ